MELHCQILPTFDLFWNPLLKYCHCENSVDKLFNCFNAKLFTDTKWSKRGQKVNLIVIYNWGPLHRDHFNDYVLDMTISKKARREAKPIHLYAGGGRICFTTAIKQSKQYNKFRASERASAPHRRITTLAYTHKNI